MQSTRLIGVVLVATGLGFHPSIAEADPSAWSTSAGACVPASGFSVTGGAVTAEPGTTVTLNCNIPPLAGGFNSIGITYKGGKTIVVGGNVPAGANLPAGWLATAEVIEMSKTTGVESSSHCARKAEGSAVVKEELNLCENSSLDFSNNYYYMRIVVRSGLAAEQQITVYGSSLILH